jgi:hypothetical protein
MSGITRVESGDSKTRAVAVTTVNPKKVCSRCKLLDAANQKTIERITSIMALGVCSLMYIINSDRVNDGLKQLIARITIHMPVVGAVSFAVMKDKPPPSLTETSDPLEQALFQNWTTKKVGIVATILYSLFFIPPFVAEHLRSKNELLGASASIFGFDSENAIRGPIMVGIFAGLLSLPFMLIKDKIYPSSSLSNAIEKKECCRCMFHQKFSEYVPVAKKVGIVAAILSSPFFTTVLARQTYSNYLSYLRMSG